MNLYYLHGGKKTISKFYLFLLLLKKSNDDEGEKTYVNELYRWIED